MINLIERRARELDAALARYPFVYSSFDRIKIFQGMGLLPLTHRLYAPWDTPTCFINGEINAAADADSDNIDQYNERRVDAYWLNWEWQVNRLGIEASRVR